MCARAYSGSVRRSECWENPALPGSVSARGIVRPAICFVKPQTTTCSAFLLGQAQDVDFHCTGFWLWPLGFRPVQADLKVRLYGLGVASYTPPELWVTQLDGLGGPVCHPDWAIVGFS